MVGSLDLFDYFVLESVVGLKTMLSPQIKTNPIALAGLGLTACELKKL